MDGALGPQIEAMKDCHVQGQGGFIEDGELVAPGSPRSDVVSEPVPISMSHVICPILSGDQEHGMGDCLEELVPTPTAEGVVPT